MIKIDVFYDIINNNIDKSKPWYCVNANIIYIKGNPNGFKYYLEGTNFNKDEGTQHFIILSKTKIHKSCRNLQVDDYGRLKIKPTSGYFKKLYTKDCNIKFELAVQVEEYNSYLV